MKTIVTIGREFGSGGREVGRRLAEELQIAYYDHEIVTEVTKRTELAEAYIQSLQEKRPFPMFSMTTGRTFLTLPNPVAEQQMEILQKESEIILEMALKTDCVIVGHCADYVLREHYPFRVFLYADREYKIERCRQREKSRNMTDRELSQKIAQVDKQRSKYYEFLISQKWGKKANYDLCINTTATNIEKL